MGEQSETTMVKGGRGVLRVRRLWRCGGDGHRLGLSEASLGVGEAGVGLLGAPAVSESSQGIYVFGSAASVAVVTHEHHPEAPRGEVQT